MKRLLSISNSLLAVLVLVLISAMSPAKAAPFYFGADGVFRGVDYQAPFDKVGPDSMFGANVYVGYDVLPNVSLEAGYLGLWHKDSFVDALLVKHTVKADVQGATGDVILHVPLIYGFEFLGDAGLTYLDGGLSSDTFDTTGYSLGWRAGIGAQVPLSKHFFWRTRVFYEQTNFANTNGDVAINSGLIVHL